MDTNSHGTIIYPRTKIRTYINLQEYKFVFVGNEFVTELYVVFCFFFLYFLFLLILLFLSFLLYLIVSAFFFFHFGCCNQIFIADISSQTRWGKKNNKTPELCLRLHLHTSYYNLIYAN